MKSLKATFVSNGEDLDVRDYRTLDQVYGETDFTLCHDILDQFWVIPKETIEIEIHLTPTPLSRESRRVTFEWVTDKLVCLLLDEEQIPTFLEQDKIIQAYLEEHKKAYLTLYLK